MNRFIFHFFVVPIIIFSSISAFLPKNVSAQVNKSNQIKIGFPSVAINSILMDEYIYAPGKDINLQINLENTSKSPNEYKESIVIFENNIDANERKMIYASSSSTIYMLKTGERLIKNSAFLIPEFVQNDIIVSYILQDRSNRQINKKDIFLKNSQIENSNSATIRDVARVVSMTVNQGVLKQEIINNPSVLASGNEEEPVVFRSSDKINLIATVENTSQNGYVKIIYGNQAFQKDIKSSLIFNFDPIRGENMVYATIYDSNGKQISATVSSTIIVDGLTGVIQAFGLINPDVKNIKRGDDVGVYVNWIPKLYAINKQEVSTNPIFNTPFSAHISLYDKDDMFIGSTTIEQVDIQAIVNIKTQKEADYLKGKITISAGDYVVTEYEKILFVAKGTTHNSLNNIWKVISITFVVALLLAVIYKSRRKKSLIALLFLCLFIPAKTHAQWESVASGVLEHYYPKSTDASTTTWRNVLVSASTNYYLNAFSQSCPVNTILTGASSNYVDIENPVISGNGKTYRWEYSWYPTRNSGTSIFNLPNWFAIQEQYAGTGAGYRYPTYPVTDSRPVLPSTNLYTRSAFIDKNTFNRVASITDNLFSTWNASWNTDTWSKYRPFRMSVSSSLHSALSTSTYSNIIPWLNARYNAFDDRPVPAGGTFKRFYLSTSGVGPINNDMMDYLVPGSYVAASGRLFYSLFSSPQKFTSTTTTSFFQTTGYTDEDLLFSFDAGSFMNKYTPNLGNTGIQASNLHRLGPYPEPGATSTRLDCIAPYNSTSCRSFDRSYLEGTYSRPGTYNLMNILVNTRLENIVPIDFDGRGSYQCQSTNAQIYSAPYEVVDNSYISVVMFNDENNDGVKQSNEKTIMGADNSSESNATSTSNGTISRLHQAGLTCSVPAGNVFANNQLPFYYATSSTQIAKLFATSTGSYTSPVPYVRTNAQTINSTYLTIFSTTSPTLKINNVDVSQERTMNTPYFWLTNSGMVTSDYSRSYDSQGRLIVKSNNQNCGNVTLISNSLGYVTSGTSTLTAEEFVKQTQTYPVPPEVANNYTAYSKFAVNSEISPTYTVGIDPLTIPAGWTRTKESGASGFEKTVTVTGGNENHVVYLGVAYATSGVCGSATSTISQTTVAPSTNLCSAGSSTTVVTNEQNFTWSCNAVGGGAGNASCEKAKCPTSSPYYCSVTDSCVLNVNDCSIAGVCGSATTNAGSISQGVSVAPTTNLCSAGTLNGVVAGQNDPVSSFTWTCSGLNGGAISPTCSQTKCSSVAGMRYCASVNECRTSCPTTETSTLISSIKLNPWIVRTSTDQCALSWNVSASEVLPVACSLNGNPLGVASSEIQRNATLQVGNSNLECSNSETRQSVVVKCQLNPSFKEI